MSICDDHCDTDCVEMHNDLLFYNVEKSHFSDANVYIMSY